MTEQEWLTCEDPRSLLEYLGNATSERKLRLFACACCRRIWHLITELPREAVTIAEEFADGLVGRKEVETVLTMALDPTSDSAVDFAVDFAAVDYRRATPISSVDTTGQLAADAAVNRLGPNVHRAKAIALERTAQCDLLRHVIGNPFRPYPAPPSWPAPVVKLAESMYAGEDCSFALHDALLEAGHPELAEHLAKEQWHPKGCWIVDLILGKV